MAFYEVKQAVAHNGNTFYGERKSGDKILPADVIEMDEEKAKAYGEKYLKKVTKKDAPKEDAPKEEKKDDKPKAKGKK